MKYALAMVVVAVINFVAKELRPSYSDEGLPLPWAIVVAAAFVAHAVEKLVSARSAPPAPAQPLLDVGWQQIAHREYQARLARGADPNSDEMRDLRSRLG